MPSDYGLIAMITVFTSIANVFVVTGFSSAIIQKKELSEVDKSTIFHCGLITAVVIYVALFFSANTISSFYHEPQLTPLLRVQSIALIISALYSTHNAILSREMKFKKSFVSSLTGVCVQSVVGIYLAYAGFGAWALVYSHLANSIVCALVTWGIVKWIPKLQFSKDSFRSMFTFSLKILCTSLFSTIFQNLQSLIIGRQYSSADLAYYNRGYQFPSLIMQQVDGSMNTVLFSSLSKYQDDWESGLRVLRHAMRTSMFVCFPLMIGMMAVAEPMILTLLTDKWIDSVPYVRLVAVLCLFWPLSAQKNALNALGKSGITLVMNVCNNGLTIIFILLTYKISPFVMIASTLVSAILFLVISAFIYRKHLKYAIRDQVSDILPTFLLSVAMGAIVYSVSFAFSSPVFTLLVQVIVGIVTYVSMAHVFKLKSYVYIMSMVKPHLLKRLKR